MNELRAPAKPCPVCGVALVRVPTGGCSIVYRCDHCKTEVVKSRLSELNCGVDNARMQGVLSFGGRFQHLDSQMVGQNDLAGIHPEQRTGQYQYTSSSAEILLQNPMAKTKPLKAHGLQGAHVKRRDPALIWINTIEKTGYDGNRS